MINGGIWEEQLNASLTDGHTGFFCAGRFGFLCLKYHVLPLRPCSANFFPDTALSVLLGPVEKVFSTSTPV